MGIFRRLTPGCVRSVGTKQGNASSGSHDSPPPVAELASSGTEAATALGLEQELEALRKNHERLKQAIRQDEDEKASERRLCDQQIEKLEAQIQDLTSHLAQHTEENTNVDETCCPGFDAVFMCCQEPAVKVDSPYKPLVPGSSKPGRFEVSKIIMALACLFVALQTALLAGISHAYFVARQGARQGANSRHKPLKVDQKLVNEERNLELDLQKSLDQAEGWEQRYMRDTQKLKEPFHLITGLKAHQVPFRYEEVREKTIWAYWYNPETCKTSFDCVLPPAVKLCTETIERNKGGFDFRIVHMDEVEQYVTKMELPMRWSELRPAQQKDSLMNALLARYGGIAMDITMLLLRPLDDYWDEMVDNGATFFGYMYRINGLPWRHAEVTTVWFLMSRREGIFNTAVRNQVSSMGDRSDSNHFPNSYLALGDQTVTPILHMFNYSLPLCIEDPSLLRPPPHPMFDQKTSMCPEHEERWKKEIVGPARTDTKVILRDPRDGPQLPFAFSKPLLWSTSDQEAFTDKQVPTTMRLPGAPMQEGTIGDCGAPAECWQTFLSRFYAPAEPGRARLLSFVKLFAHAKELRGMDREEILRHTESYFVHWLQIAGVV